MSKKAERDDDECVSRGGSGRNTPALARVAFRFRHQQGSRYVNVGVRLVRRRSALEWLAESLRGVTDEHD